MMMMMMSLWSWTALAMALIGDAGASNLTVVDADRRQDRVISLFNVVKFENGLCSSSSSFTTTAGTSVRMGTCYTSQECTNLGGSANGACAKGFGVCCVFATSSCGASVVNNCTYIRNPGFPAATTAATACNFVVRKSDATVCSLRLDFESFSILANADTIEANFVCQDSFTITQLSSGQAIPTICGLNDGQHIYVDLGADPADSASLNFAFAAAPVVGNRRWEIKVSQIFCNYRMRPPVGCLQYLTGTQGSFRTFNFDGTNGHLISQNYGICIRQEAGFCCIRYFPCADPQSFSLDINAAIANANANVDTDCTTDYIVIEASSSTCSVANNHNRYCGSFLSDETTSTASTQICTCNQPFLVRIRTDAAADAAADRLSKGVCLTYSQVPC